MADREFLDLFVRLKGEINQLERLKTRGVDIKANIVFNKAGGGGFAQLEKLKKTLNINVKLNLTGKGYEKIKELQKGIEIPVKFRYTQKDILSTSSSKGNAQRQTSQPAGINVAKRYQPSQVSKLTARKASGDLSNYADQIIDEQISNAIKLRAFTKSAPSRGIGTSRVFTSSSGGILNFLDKKTVQSLQKSVANELVSNLPTTRSYTNTSPIRQIGSRRAIVGPTQTVKEFDDLGKELKKINDRAKTDTRSATTRVPLYQQAFPSESSIEARDKFIQDRANARRQSRRFRENLRSARLSRFRERENLDEAQKEFDLSPTFLPEDERRRKIAFSRGILPGDLQKPRRQNFFARNTGGFINPERLLDRETIREIGFAGLFGQGLLGKAAGVSGALIGGSISEGGAFLGATTAELALEGLLGNLEKLGSALEEVSRAGLQFEESILGISSVLQATTTITGPGGQTLPIGQQLQFQEGRARDIQLKARKELLPLGIGGETEAAIVQGIITGFAQKGVQLTPDQIATLARRIGAATQAQRPDLLSNINRLRLEIEDSISNPSRRTALTPVLRGYAPNLGRATSGEEAVRSTQGLEPFAESLTNNPNNPVVAIRQFETLFENIKVAAGSEFLRTLTPAIKELTDLLSNSNVQKSLTDITRSLAQFFVFLTDVGVKLTKSLVPKTAEGSGAVAGGILGGIGSAIVNGLVGGITGGLIAGPAGLLPGAVVGAVGGAGFGAIGGSISGARFGSEAEKNAKAREEADKKEREAEERLRSQANPLTLLNSLLGGEGAGPGGASSILSAQLGSSLIPLVNETIKSNSLQGIAKDPDKQKRLDALKSLDFEIKTQEAYFRTEIAAQKSSGLKDLQSRRRELFDTSLASGASRQAQVDVSFLGARSGSVKEEISALDNLVKSIKEEKFDKSDIAQRVSNAKRLIEAEENLAKKREELTSITLEAADAARKFFSAISARESELLSGVDQGTIVGQEKAATIRKKALDARRALLPTLTGEQRSLEERRLNVADIQEGRSDTLRRFGNAQTFLSANTSIFDFKELHDSLAEKLQGYENSLAEANIGVKHSVLAFDSISISFKELNQSTQALSRSMDLYESGIQARILGGQAELISLEEQNIAFGGTPTGKVDLSLVRGAPGFNPTSRSLFDQQLVQAKIDEAETRQNQLPNQISSDRENFRIQQDQQDLQKQELELRKQELPIRLEEAKLRVSQAKRNIDRFPIESATAEFSSLKQLIELKNILPQGSDIFKKVTDLLNKSIGLSDIFKSFGGFENFEKTIKDQGGAVGGFEDIVQTALTKLDISIPSIDETTKEIRDILKSLIDQKKSDNKRLKEDAIKGPQPEKPKPFLDPRTGKPTPFTGGTIGTGTSPQPTSGTTYIDPNTGKPTTSVSNNPLQKPGDVIYKAVSDTIDKVTGNTPNPKLPPASNLPVDFYVSTFGGNTTSRVSDKGFSKDQIGSLKSLYMDALTNPDPAAREESKKKYLEMLKQNKDLTITGTPSPAIANLFNNSILQSGGDTGLIAQAGSLAGSGNLSVPAGQPVTISGGLTGNVTEIGSPPIPPSLRSTIASLSPELYDKFIADAKSRGVSQEVIDQWGKWRYPPGYYKDNIYDRYKNKATLGLPGSEDPNSLSAQSLGTVAGGNGSSTIGGLLSTLSITENTPSLVTAGSAPGGIEGLTNSFDLAKPSGYKKFVSNNDPMVNLPGYKKFVGGSASPGASLVGNVEKNNLVAETVLGGLVGAPTYAGPKPEVYDKSNPKLASVVKDLSKISPPSTEKATANKEVGAEILAALLDIGSTLRNPDGIGAQVKSALNSTFAGGN